MICVDIANKVLINKNSKVVMKNCFRFVECLWKLAKNCNYKSSVIK